MSVKCYEEHSSVKLVNGRSPHDGFVVFETNTYVCPEGFDDRAADLLCGRLGFPAVEEYLNQTLPGIVTINGFIQLRCGEADKFLEECSLTTIECPSNQVVRLKCREPAFIGCYKGAGQTLQSLVSHNDEIHVHSEDECMSTCQRVSGGQDVAVVHRRSCVCLQLEEFANFITGGRYSHNWTCPSQTQLDSDQVFFTAFNLSVGFCNHPGNVSNGQWNSNTTNFGSVITLCCGEGYVTNGSKTLQCLSLPGKSTFFPVWNDTVPSCRAIKNEIHENTLRNVTPSTSTRNSIDYSNIAADSYASQWPTTMKETTVVSPSDLRFARIKFITYILGTLFGVVFAVLVILSAWRKHQQKRRRQVSSHSKVLSSEGLSQLDPPNTSSHTEGTGDHGGTSSHPENTYENCGAGHMSPNLSLETTVNSGRGIESSAETGSRSSYDVIHHLKHVHECTNEAADNTKALYMEMSGAGKKGKKKVVILQSRHISEEEEDVDEDGYLLSNVSLHRGIRFQPAVSQDSKEPRGIDTVLPCGNKVGTALSYQPTRAAGDTSQSENVQSSIYHEISSASDQSAAIPEPQHSPTYLNIEGNYELGPYAMTLNDPSYSVSIYPSTSREEHEVDEHGYLVLEADTDGNTNDCFENQNNLLPTKIVLYKSTISARTEDHFNSTVYDSIPDEPKL
ncbi:uncharacterized protein [Diadema setosum]|uniref:uncharacterized protein n=1 Tax=Diadema setosum TaxID=31175 RepID=UPI003B3B82D1